MYEVDDSETGVKKVEWKWGQSPASVQELLDVVAREFPDISLEKI